MSGETNPGRATIAYACSYLTARRFEMRRQVALRVLKPKRVLTSWSPALDLCLLAEGCIEAFVGDRNELYDFVAGKLIAQEAGGIVSNLRGQRTRTDAADSFMVSCSRVLQQKLITVLR